MATIRDHPRELFDAIAALWADTTGGDAFSDWVAKPGRPLPDIVPGTTNPDDRTTRWEWTTDLTTEQAADFDAIVARLGGDTSEPTEAAIDALVTTMKNYRNASSPTDAQTVAAVKATIDYVRFLARKTVR